MSSQLPNLAAVLLVIATHLLGIASQCTAADSVVIPRKSNRAADERFNSVAERRKGIDIICHRGASEFAFENTLEAFLATFLMGADGNEIDPRWNNPRSWTDFRVKMVIFPALRKCPGAATEKLCRDYLALSDAQARELCPISFEEAGQTLLAVNPTTATAVELMRHRLQGVRGRAILDCLAHSNQAWAFEALKTEAPHALSYRVDVVDVVDE